MTRRSVTLPDCERKQTDLDPTGRGNLYSSDKDDRSSKGYGQLSLGLGTLCQVLRDGRSDGRGGEGSIEREKDFRKGDRGAVQEG